MKRRDFLHEFVCVCQVNLFTSFRGKTSTHYIVSGQTLFSDSKDPTARQGLGFRIYAHVSDTVRLSPDLITKWGWSIQWIGVGIPQEGIAGSVVPKWNTDQDLNGNPVYYTEVIA